jgi:hypothetical protein
MAQKYVVTVNGEEVKSFDNQKDAEDFRRSVAGSVQSVEVTTEGEDTAQRATQ